MEIVQKYLSNGHIRRPLLKEQCLKYTDQLNLQNRLEIAPPFQSYDYLANDHSMLLHGIK